MIKVQDHLVSNSVEGETRISGHCTDQLGSALDDDFWMGEQHPSDAEASQDHEDLRPSGKRAACTLQS